MNQTVRQLEDAYRAADTLLSRDRDRQGFEQAALAYQPPRTHKRWGSQHSTWRNTPEIDWTGVPSKFWGKVSAICRSFSDCLDLEKWFGDGEFEPDLPILLIVPTPEGGFVHCQSAGWGLTSVWEHRDVATEVWEKTTRKLAVGEGLVFDFDEAREKHGLIRREDVDTAVRYALRDAAAKHKASPRTNPGRQPKYPNPLGKVKFPEQPVQAWKGE